MSSNTDSAPVRTGEELDVEALRTYLNQALGSDGSSLEIRQFPGGHSNLTYLIRYGSNEFVLRRPPVGPVAPTAHDMPREFKLLEYLLRHAGKVVTRTMLLENVWDYHFDPQTNVIDVHISKLRQKIDAGSPKPLLHTVQGAGYRLGAG